MKKPRVFSLPGDWKCFTVDVGEQSVVIDLTTVMLVYYVGY